MSVLVWAMMGIASWHLAVLVLDSVETKLRSTRSVSDLAAADLVGSRVLKHLRAAVSEPVAAAQSPPAAMQPATHCRRPCSRRRLRHG